MFVCLASLGLPACGGNERQDEDEAEGTYRVEVLQASFPERQDLAERSDLLLLVRNADTKAIPNLTVTVRGFGFRSAEPRLSDPVRPRFLINGKQTRIGGFSEAKEEGPSGCTTSYVDTWACGRLEPGREKVLRWNVTAVRAGPFRIKYTVAAGLHGKAKAVEEGGAPTTGTLSGTVAKEAPTTRVADDGETVVEGAR